MENKKITNEDKISKILMDPDKVIEAIQSGIYEALIKHQQLGNSVCEWRDDKIVWVQSDQIPTEIKNINK